jgi:hypothetical protein
MPVNGGNYRKELLQFDDNMTVKLQFDDEIDAAGPWRSNAKSVAARFMGRWYSSAYLPGPNLAG